MSSGVAAPPSHCCLLLSHGRTTALLMWMPTKLGGTKGSPLALLLVLELELPPVPCPSPPAPQPVMLTSAARHASARVNVPMFSSLAPCDALRHHLMAPPGGRRRSSPPRGGSGWSRRSDLQLHWIPP